MKSAVLFFALLTLVSAKWTDPLWHSLTPLDASKFPRSTMYKTLTSISRIGQPIFFSGSNATAVYNDHTWFNPCLERALTNTATFVYFWLVGNDAYCSIHKSSSSVQSSTAPFAEKYLARIERISTRCE